MAGKSVIRIRTAIRAYNRKDGQVRLNVNPIRAKAYLRQSSSLLLLWIYYSSQIMLFGAEFTQVYATHAGQGVKPDQYSVRIETKEVESSDSD
jgi:hypothetical protein